MIKIAWFLYSSFFLNSLTHYRLLQTHTNWLEKQKNTLLIQTKLQVWQLYAIIKFHLSSIFWFCYICCQCTLFSLHSPRDTIDSILIISISFFNFSSESSSNCSFHCTSNTKLSLILLMCPYAAFYLLMLEYGEVTEFTKCLLWSASLWWWWIGSLCNNRQLFSIFRWSFLLGPHSEVGVMIWRLFIE